MIADVVLRLMIVALARVPALTEVGSGQLLSIRVEPDKSTVILGEPVFITATAMNRGSKPVELIYHNAPAYAGYAFVDLHFAHGEKHTRSWRDDLRPRKEQSPMLVRPGESVAVELVMLFNSREGLFADKPGTYWIRGRAVIVADPYIEVFSDPVKIEVVEPPKDQQATWKWLEAHKQEYGRLIQVPWEAKLPDSFVEQCAQICDDPQSVYVEYLALSLSRWYREGAGKDRAEAARYARIAELRASSDMVAKLAADAVAASK